MSRVGKKNIQIPEGTNVTNNDGLLTVKGPKGELVRKFTSDITINITGNEITLTPKKETIDTKALWGTYSSHIQNMIEGVNKLFERKLSLEGVGYKVELNGKNLKFALGFSHDVLVPVPDDIKASIEKNTILLEGSDKERIGYFAAKLRDLKKPEPYKGKGLRYSDEIVRRKQGKKNV